MRHLGAVGAAVVVALVGAAEPQGQKAGGWVGQQVITRPGTVLKVGRKVVADDRRDARSRGGPRHLVRVYRVERTNGPWLWLVALQEGNSGWARAAQVVPCDRARDEFTSALRVNPKDVSAFLARGILGHEKGEYDKAIADFDQAIKLDPKDATAYSCRGAAWYEEREYDKALADFDEAIRLDPKDATAYNKRSTVWSEMGAHDKAMADCNEAIRLNPRYARAYSNRAFLWHKQGAHDKALADFDEAIRLDPGDARAYNWRGFVWCEEGEWDKALPDLNEAIRLNPRYARPYHNRGGVWYKKGEFDQALVDLNEAMRLDPKYARTHNNRGIIWFQKGAYDQAIADLTTAVRLDPSYVAAYYHRSGLWREKGEYPKAIADCNDAIRLDPEFAPAYELRASIWAACADAQVRDGKRAVESATRACELTHWKRPECLEILAAAYAEAGDFDAAVKWQEAWLDAANGEMSKERARARLSCYRAQMPYHKGPAAPAIGKVGQGVDLSVQQVEAAVGVPPRADDAVARTSVPVVARVGAAVITLEELKDAVQTRIAKLPDGYKPNHEEIKLLTAQVLDMLVERCVLTEAAKRELNRSEQMKLLMEIAVGAWCEEELPPLLRTMGVANASELRKKLAAQGRSLDAILETYRLEFLARGYMEQKLKAKVTPSDAELRAYYDAHPDDFRRDFGPAPFADVEEDVRTILRRQKIDREATTFIDALRRQTVVTTIYDAPAGAEPEP